MSRQQPWWHRGVGLSVWVLALIMLVLVPIESALVEISVPAHWDPTPKLQSASVPVFQPVSVAIPPRLAGL